MASGRGWCGAMRMLTGVVRCAPPRSPAHSNRQRPAGPLTATGWPRTAWPAPTPSVQTANDGVARNFGNKDAG